MLFIFQAALLTKLTRDIALSWELSPVKDQIRTVTTGVDRKRLFTTSNDRKIPETTSYDL